MHHSQSTPAVLGSANRTPPMTPKKAGKMLSIRVQLLDDSVTIFQVQAKAVGRLLFDQVCKQLHLLEADYFGLEYVGNSSGTDSIISTGWRTTSMNNNNNDGGATPYSHICVASRYWLDLEKPMSRQLGLSLIDPLLFFCVKFYTPDPSQLEEEYTRYLFCLQIKRDLAHGLMQCNENTAALMASYIVQAECGDFVFEDYPDHSYLSSYKFIPNQDAEFECKIMENHKKHIGQSPAEADLNLLETSRRCEFYGIKLHTAKDHDEVVLNLAVAHMGILVFQNYTKINTFSWAKIRKISFKRKKFLIKLHSEGYGYYKEIVDFFFDGRDECKNFWKKCVEYHCFFRCSSVKRTPRHKARVLSRGSSFRYSGKTQKQIVEYVRQNYVKRQAFQRSASFRHSSVHSSASNMMHPASAPTANVGNSISAHPLLPLADANLNHGIYPNLNDTLRSANFVKQCADNASASLIFRTKDIQLSTADHFSQKRNIYCNDLIKDDISNEHALHTTNGNVAGLGINDYQFSSKNDSTNEMCTYTTSTKKNVATVLPLQQSHSIISITTVVADIEKNSYLQQNKLESDCLNTDEKALQCTTHSDYFEKIYFIAKELLMTEITYKKDLDLINVWFRQRVPEETISECFILFSLISSLSYAHGELVKDLENRLQRWNYNRRPRATLNCCIADILLIHLPPLLPVYEEYIDGHVTILEKLEYLFNHNIKFQLLYREFEAQKVCYLPFSNFILKPLHRLLNYDSILQKLLLYYGDTHPDRINCLNAKELLSSTIVPIRDVMQLSQNMIVISELQRDINGFDDLLQPNRKFIRHGCLLKFSRQKGYKQHMFFLFSDVLLYATRSQSTLKFRVHGHMPLRGVLLEEPDGDLADYGLIIYGCNRALTVAANSLDDKNSWMVDLQAAIQFARRNKTDTKTVNLSLKSGSSSDELTTEDEHTENEHTENLNSQTSQSIKANNDGNESVMHNAIEVGTQTKVSPTPMHRSNTTVHVCWHRNTSISMSDQLNAIQSQLSGYLLRKFKSANGWQKLWVVYASFCLFFYKGCMDDYPLASLPLLGYYVGMPTAEDKILKDYVFKLQYKNHVYFFRAESEYTYNRWLEVIGNSVITNTALKKSPILVMKNSARNDKQCIEKNNIPPTNPKYQYVTVTSS